LGTSTCKLIAACGLAPAGAKPQAARGSGSNMSHRFIPPWGIAVVALILTTAPPAPPQDEAQKPPKQSPRQATRQNGAVCAGGQGAVEAGLTLLKSGGNAADAAAATILALSVTDSGAFCFGGEVPILVYNAKRNVIEVLCGLGTAPRLATREYFAKHGSIPGKGIEPAAVPAALDACLTLLDRHGTKTFTEAVAP